MPISNTVKHTGGIANFALINIFPRPQQIVELCELSDEVGCQHIMLLTTATIVFMGTIARRCVCREGYERKQFECHACALGHFRTFVRIHIRAPSVWSVLCRLTGTVNCKSTNSFTEDTAADDLQDCLCEVDMNGTTHTV